MVQSICRDVIGDIRKLRGRTEAAFRSWLYAVASNKLANKHDFHLAARRNLEKERQFDSRVEDAAILDSLKNAVGPADAAEAREEIERIEAALDRLPADWRDAIMNVSIAGLSYREAAQIMGRSEDSLRQLLYRARARLAMLLS